MTDAEIRQQLADQAEDGASPDDAGIAALIRAYAEMLEDEDGEPGDVPDDPRERARHIECAEMFFGAHMSVRRVALLLGIPVATACRWAVQALLYPDPEARLARRMARDWRPLARYATDCD